MPERTEADAVADIARQNDRRVPIVDGVVGIIRADGDDSEAVEIIDDQQYLGHPRRAKGTQRLDTEVAFAAYVNLHGVAGMTAVYADQDALQLTAVLNEHESGDSREAGWRDWRAQLTFEHGRAWIAWLNVNEEWLEQATFIDMLEDRIGDVTDPPATTLLDIVRNFSMQKSVTFRSAQSLTSGAVQLQYDEEVQQAGARTGQMEVPDRISLALDPIKGDDPFDVKARLRWRVSDGGKLKVLIKLDRLDDVLEAAWAAVVARVTPAVLPYPVLEGKP